MIPKIMLRPMVEMKMKKDTWYKTSGQKLLKEPACGLTLISCDVTKVVVIVVARAYYALGSKLVYLVISIHTYTNILKNVLSQYIWPVQLYL